MPPIADTQIIKQKTFYIYANLILYHRKSKSFHRHKENFAAYMSLHCMNANFSQVATWRIGFVLDTYLCS